MEEFINSLESTFAAVDLSSTDVMLVGDFNAISSSWCVSDTTNLPGRLLEPTFLSLGLDQCVSSRTHVDSNGHLTSLLDLVLMSDSGLLNAVETLPPVGNSDHLPVLCQLSTLLSTSSNSSSRRIWCYDRADFKALKSALAESDWSAVANAEDINGAWAAWLKVFLDSVSKHVPSKVIKHIKPKLPWMTSRIESEIKSKHYLFRRLKRSPTHSNREAFNKQRNKVTSLLRKAERAYELTFYRTSRRYPSASSDFWEES